MCTVDGCSRKIVAKGFCGLHYQRMLSGKPMSDEVKASNGALLSYLESLVGAKELENCIPFPFKSHSVAGYGLARYKGRQVGAHRIVCILAHGEPPEDKQLATHSCGKGHEGCVNPNHLRWGSIADNKADMVAHGTVVRGLKVKSASLSEDNVRRIHRDYSLGLSCKDISDAYGTTRSNVCRIGKGHRWGWLTEAAFN